MEKNIIKKAYRKGAIAALMDEYERAATDLKKIVDQISESEFTKVIYPNATDEDCKSVQTVVSHVINSGYGYSNYIRDWFSIQTDSPSRRLYSKIEFSNELNKMLFYCGETLKDKWELNDDEITNININSRCGKHYDLEQLLEHAVLHILRHRRQIEKFVSLEMIKLI